MAEGKYGRLFTEADVKQMMQWAFVAGQDPNAYTFVPDPIEAYERVEGRYPERMQAQPPPTFPADEPLFLMRGQDGAAIGGVTGYYVAAKALGASQDHGLAVVDAARRFADFAREHPDRVKVPD